MAVKLTESRFLFAYRVTHVDVREPKDATGILKARDQIIVQKTVIARFVRLGLVFPSGRRTRCAKVGMVFIVPCALERDSQPRPICFELKKPLSRCTRKSRRKSTNVKTLLSVGTNVCCAKAEVGIP